MIGWFGALSGVCALCCWNCCSTAVRVESLTPPATINDSRRDSSDSGPGVPGASIEPALVSDSGFQVEVIPGNRSAARARAKFIRSTKAPVLTHAEAWEV